MNDKFDDIERLRRFNRDFTVRLGLLSRHRFDGRFTLLEARVLLEIGRGGGATFAGLLRRLRVDQGYLSRVLAKLGAAGLVDSRPDPRDGRAKLLALSPAGQAELADIDRRSVGQAEGMLAHLGAADRALFFQRLEELDELLGPIGPAGVPIRRVTDPGLAAAFPPLIREYQRELGVDLCFQDFEREMAEFPGAYGEPGGALFLAGDPGDPAGCVALRPLGPGVAELKRLYLRPRWRGCGLGRALSLAAIARARALGYAALRLDTLASMEPANALYRALGFRPIDAYYDNPLPGVVYYELALA